jgi:hypothetical protein
MSDKFMDSMMSDIDNEEVADRAEVAEPVIEDNDDDDSGVVDPFFAGSQESSSGSDSEDSGSSPSQPSISGTTLTYTANGQEHSIDISSEEGKKKAREALSLMTASRQAMSSVAKDRKKAKELEAKVAQMSEIEKKFEFLSELQRNGQTKELYKALTGEEFDDALEKYARNKLLWQQAENDPQLKQRLLEKEELEKVRREYSSIKSKQEAETKAREAMQEKHEEEKMRSLVTGEFNKAMDSLKDLDEGSLSNARSMVWSSAVNELARLSDTHDVENPKLVRYVIEKYANNFKDLAEKKAAEQVKTIIDDKKKTSKEKAQVASTNKYPKGEGKEDAEAMSKMNPKELFKFLTRK